METVLMIVATLSLVAFVVGLFNPKVVKCSSRGKATLVYLSIFIIAGFIGADVSNDSKPTFKEESSNNTETVQGKPTKDVDVLRIGSDLTIPFANSEVIVNFKNVEVKRIPSGGLNLILTLRIKNNTNEEFFISNVGWKLLDADKIEVEESGIYEPMFDDFAPGTFFFTIVEPNIGKEEKVGYSVKEETYYLSVNGHIVAKIPLDANEK